MSRPTSPEQPDNYNLSALNNPDAEAALVSFRQRREKFGEGICEGSQWPTQDEIDNMTGEEKRQAEYWAKLRGHAGGHTYVHRSAPARSTRHLFEEGPDPRWVTAGLTAGVLTVGLVCNGIAGSMVDSSYGDIAATQFVSGQGYKDVQETGKHRLLVDFQGCDSSDLVAYDFTAKDVQGIVTKLVVCKGSFKGATIRQH